MVLYKTRDGLLDEWCYFAAEKREKLIRPPATK